MSRPRPLDARYAPGEDPEPLLRALAGGLLGGGLALLVDRLLPSGALAVFEAQSGAAEPLPGGMLWPALLGELVGAGPRATGVGASAFLIGLSLASFVYVFGQLRRFLPAGPWARGASWAALLWLLVCPSILPLARTWLGAGAAGGSSAGAAVLAGGWLLLEPGLALLAYGLLLGWLCERPDPAIPTPTPAAHAEEGAP